MTIKEIKELQLAVVKLNKFCHGGAIRRERGNIDKFGTGFNVDGRRKMCGTYTLFYDTHYGYYGYSDCSSQIELPSSTHSLFWECFKEYLNEHQDEVLDAVCQKMQKSLSEETGAIQEEIDRLNALKADLEKIKENEID